MLVVVVVVEGWLLAVLLGMLAVLALAVTDDNKAPSTCSAASFLGSVDAMDGSTVKRDRSIFLRWGRLIGKFNDNSIVVPAS